MTGGRLKHLVPDHTCHEYLGKTHGECGQPATDGLCPHHHQERINWLERTGRR